jgi:hypothetical protein
MAHAPSPGGYGHASAAHASADDEYLATPPGSGHEHTDANVWIIVKFGIWLAISAVVIHVGLGFLFALFVKQSEETVVEFPLAGQEHRLPAAPRLQQFPENEFHEFRLREDAVLQQYGWVNRETGVVRMPIEQAMRLAVERGLPVRAAVNPAAPQAVPEPQPVPAPSQTPGLMPADSSAGRTMERRRQ